MKTFAEMFREVRAQNPGLAVPVLIIKTKQAMREQDASSS